MVTEVTQETNFSIAVVEQNLKFSRRLTEEYVIIQKGMIVAQGKMAGLDDEIIK